MRLPSQERTEGADNEKKEGRWEFDATDVLHGEGRCVLRKTHAGDPGGQIIETKSREDRGRSGLQELPVIPGSAQL